MFFSSRPCFRFDLMCPDQEKNWCHLSCIGVISTTSSCPNSSRTSSNGREWSWLGEVAEKEICVWKVDIRSRGFRSYLVEKVHKIFNIFWSTIYRLLFQNWFKSAHHSLNVSIKTFKAINRSLRNSLLPSPAKPTLRLHKSSVDQFEYTLRNFPLQKPLLLSLNRHSESDEKCDRHV